jgi:hypothetical protein|tara:strand:+ start:4249 stop:5628 length:1380 start_codon:yes stop_codon:yes gene_type:complete
MADRKSRLFTLDKMEIAIPSGDPPTYDIRDLVIDFNYTESIDSPFIRCDFTMIDAIDFNKLLIGGEIITVKLTTESSTLDGDKKSLEFKVRVFKIGSTIKSERGQLYILHCTSPEAYPNEMNKVFKPFGPAGKDVDHIPKHICKEYLSAPKEKTKDVNFEPHSKISFISTNWRPVEAISYMSDKVTRIEGSGSGKTSRKQSGFLFYENRYGFNFKSLDALCLGSGVPEGTEIFEYTYIQQGNDPPNNGYHTIEKISYPDRANHLRNMRMGTFKTAAISISMPRPTNSNATDTGSTEDTAPAGTIHSPKVLSYAQVFTKADTIHKRKPYDLPSDLEEFDGATRIKYRALPGLKNQANLDDPENGTNPDDDTMAVAEYAASRYNLLQAIQLSIVVPGNSALTAGMLIKVRIPASQEKQRSLKEDLRYSGKYLISAVTHTFTKEGLTSKLVLTRDSVMKDIY